MLVEYEKENLEELSHSIALSIAHLVTYSEPSVEAHRRGSDEVSKGIVLFNHLDEPDRMPQR